MTDENQDEAGQSDETGVVEGTVETVAKTEESGDPLDAISDPEVLRSKAKGYRSERNTWKGKASDLIEKAPSSSLDRPFTRGEVVKQNEKTGLGLASEDIRANRDKILPYYRADYGGDIPSPEEIAERWKDAEAAYLRRHPKSEEDKSAELQTDTGTTPSGKQTEKKEKVTLMGDHSETPQDWFKG
jgi:hypothetical protein